MIVGRDGHQRIWDLTERTLPPVRRRAPKLLAAHVVDGQLRAAGLERLDRIGRLFDGPLPGRDRAIAEKTRSGTIVPVDVDGLRGQWVTHRELLNAPFRGRTTLLSPFDDLISDRDRTERLFDFRYRLEIYVPKAKREFGYYVLPILHGDRLVGRIDPTFDRTSGVLRINAVYAEPDAPGKAWGAARRAIDDLARWLGAEEVRLPKLPPVWR
jgi:uncharacterized protein YcaQ